MVSEVVNAISFASVTPRCSTSEEPVPSVLVGQVKLRVRDRGSVSQE